MRVLIVEDNAFNAYCLRRLLESLNSAIKVTISSTSLAALAQMHLNAPDLVIIDGHLGNVHELCHGPALADQIFKKYPYVPVIAWTDSKPMREQFATIFKQHHRIMDETCVWSKMVSIERIRKSLVSQVGEWAPVRQQPQYLSAYAG